GPGPGASRCRLLRGAASGRAGAAIGGAGVRCRGQVAELGTGGVQCGLGALGAAALQVGELVAGLQLGVVGGVQGVAFAGGVGAGALDLGAGADLGLAGAGDLGVGADAYRCRVFGRLAGLLLAGVSVGTGSGDRRSGGGAGGRGVVAGRCCLVQGLPGACLGVLLQAAGGLQGFDRGLQFLVGFGGLGVRGGGSGLGAAAGGVGGGELRADMLRVELG